MVVFVRRDMQIQNQPIYYTAAAHCVNLTNVLGGNAWNNLLTQAGIPFTYTSNGSISRDHASTQNLSFCEE